MNSSDALNKYLSNVNGSDIEKWAPDMDTYRRGCSYYRNGNVKKVTATPVALMGIVENDMGTQYTQVISSEDGKHWQGICSCPDQRGGWCKHLIAVALYSLFSPSKVISQDKHWTLFKEITRYNGYADQFHRIIKAPLGDILWALEKLTATEFRNWLNSLNDQYNSNPANFKVSKTRWT